MNAPPVRPTFVFLHALGGSAKSWDDLRPHLEPVGTCLAVDLPGFGDLAEGFVAGSPHPIDHTLNHLATGIRNDIRGPWILVGHSMGGKYASLLAARQPKGLAGVVLIAASPPAPEPMDEARRQEMLDWVKHGPLSETDARIFIDANTAHPLRPDIEDRAIADLRRTSPAAWNEWLTRGASEDRSADMRPIEVPALILAGEEDGDLGTANQRALNLPYYPNGALRIIGGAAHLIPAERPTIVAAHILSLWRKVELLASIP